MGEHPRDGQYIRCVKAKQQLLGCHQCSIGSDFSFMNINLLNQESSFFLLQIKAQY